MACISFAAGRPFLRRHHAGGGPTSACESGWFRGRGCDVSGGGYRCCRSHRETNLGRATKVPCKVAVLVPWCYRSRSSSRAHPHRQITGSRHYGRAALCLTSISGATATCTNWDYPECRTSGGRWRGFLVSSFDAHVKRHDVQLQIFQTWMQVSKPAPRDASTTASFVTQAMRVLVCES